MPDIPRPDLSSTNQQIAETIAFDGTHFNKHGRRDFKLKSPKDYARLIRQILDNPHIYGFTARVGGEYLGLTAGKLSPEATLQVFFDPKRRIIVKTHLERLDNGKHIVSGTAYPAVKGHVDFLRAIRKNAEEGGHQTIQIEKQAHYFIRQAQKGFGGRDAILAKPRTELKIRIRNNRAAWRTRSQPHAYFGPMASPPTASTFIADKISRSLTGVPYHSPSAADFSDVIAPGVLNLMGSAAIPVTYPHGQVSAPAMIGIFTTSTNWLNQQHINDKNLLLRTEFSRKSTLSPPAAHP